MYNLNYTNQKHLVNDDLITKIKEDFSEVDNILNTTNNNIMLIGQFEPDFVASYAMYNNVIIWHDTADQKVVYKYESLNNKIKYFEGTLEEFIEEYIDTDMDLIIANPPYGKIGAEITKGIIDNINFKTYINLLPANDYKRNTTKDLYNYQSDMETINKGFADAVVTTHLARIHKSKVNNMTLDEFERSQYIDPRLDKYFEENSKRNHYAIDAGITWLIFAEKSDMTKTVILDHRCIPNKHLAYSMNTAEYKWNVLENIDNDSLAASSTSLSTPGKMNKYVVKLNTSIEKQNMVNFIYSENGFKFISKIFKALNTDSTLELTKWFPKVDWTKSWTVEEILTDYGYTKTEIAGVMADLNNFKGMED